MRRNENEQILYFDKKDEISDRKRKQARIELRALREALPLKIVKQKDDDRKEFGNLENIGKKRVSSFSVSESIDLKYLANVAKNDSFFIKTTNYYGECLYGRIKFPGKEDQTADIFFFEYGVIVTWGLTEKQEDIILMRYKNSFISEYIDTLKEYEIFFYMINNELTSSYFSNDAFFLTHDDYFNKMVISNALAQSVKLDYFEEILEEIIDAVKTLPAELEKRGAVDKNRKELLRMIGRMYRLKFDLNLVSNILDDPEIIWYYTDYSSLYEVMCRCLEIKSRSDLLNKRADTISSILTILNENNNGNYDSTYIVGGIIVFFQFLIIIVLLLIYFK